jgi:hypothetical protein
VTHYHFYLITNAENTTEGGKQIFAGPSDPIANY